MLSSFAAGTLTIKEIDVSCFIFFVTDETFSGAFFRFFKLFLEVFTIRVDGMSEAATLYLFNSTTVTRTSYCIRRLRKDNCTLKTSTQTYIVSRINWGLGQCSFHHKSILLWAMNHCPFMLPSLSLQWPRIHLSTVFNGQQTVNYASSQKMLFTYWYEILTSSPVV